MASKSKSKSHKTKTHSKPSAYCALPPMQPREFSSKMGLDRQRSIINLQTKWVNGTELRYCFFQSPAAWRGSDSNKALVRQAFGAWADIGIGLRFIEVDDPAEAEIRIGFEQHDGYWSYLGRQVLEYGPSEKTMNLAPPFDLDTAIHEIGHSIGLPHEHQNPNAGIDWNEPAVYADLAAPPNNWSPEKTFYNILRKLSPGEVLGSSWDPNSVMHYQFEAALIDAPKPFSDDGIFPSPGLSEQDKKWTKKYYPLIKETIPELKPFRSLSKSIDPGEQIDLRITPKASRKYKIQTFGESDTVMVLFEEVDGQLRHRASDDDSGEDSNAKITAKLYTGRNYILRTRLYWQYSKGDFALMMW